MSSRPHKYRAKPTVVDGIRFASMKEAGHYQGLKLREKAGEIWDLELQPRYPIEVRGVKVCTYVGDFRYRERGDLVSKGDGQAHFLVVDDVKGFKTPVYRLKKKLVEALYGIEIREV
jgi:hypothetical protein